MTSRIASSRFAALFLLAAVPASAQLLTLLEKETGGNLGGACLADAKLTGAAINASTNFADAVRCRTVMPDGRIDNSGCNLGTDCCPTCDAAHPCPAGQFCEFPVGDCGEGQAGECRPASAEPCNLCSEFLGGPVCGCDMMTYPSDCDRRAAGMAKRMDGPCF